MGAVYGRLLFNVALNRPTFQCSALNIPEYGGDYTGERAVDGNTDPVAMKLGHSCVHTESQDDPWSLLATPTCW